MKIAIFNDNTPNQINGAAEVGRHLIRSLINANHEIILVSPGLTCNQSVLLNDSFYFINIPSIPFFLYPECRISGMVSKRKLKCIRCFDPDIVIVLTPFSVGMNGMYFSQLYDVPLVSLFLTDFASLAKYYGLNRFSKLMWKIQNIILKNSSKIFVPSQYAKNLLESNGFENIKEFKLAASNIYFRPRGIDEKTTLIGKWRSDTVNWLYVGRIARDKNITLLINAASEMPNVRLNIVGDGPYKKELIRKLPINVALLGYIRGKRLARIYRGASCFIMPSVEEIGGMAIIEAILSNLPIFAFNGKATSELFKHGDNGLMFNSKDNFYKLIKNFSNLKILNKFSQTRASSFEYGNWSKLGSEITQNYYSLNSNRIIFPLNTKYSLSQQ